MCGTGGVGHFVTSDSGSQNFQSSLFLSRVAGRRPGVGSSFRGGCDVFRGFRNRLCRVPHLVKGGFVHLTLFQQQRMEFALSFRRHVSQSLAFTLTVGGL